MATRFTRRFRGTLAGLALAGVVVVASLVAWTAGAAASFGALLDEADAVRSADPARFLVLLEQLDAQAGDATPGEQWRLRFLHTWKSALSGRFDEAIGELKQLFDAAPDVDSRFRAGTFLVNNYAATRQFAEGLGTLDQMLVLLPQVKDVELRQQGLVVAAVIYNQVGQYDLARNYADQVLAEPTVSGRNRCMAAYMRLEALFNLKQLPADDAPFHDNISQCMAEREVLVANYIRGHLARKWFSQGETGRAIGLLEGSLGEIMGTRYPRLIGEIQSLLAELHLANGAAGNAERYAREAIAQSGDVAYVLPVVMAYKTLYESATARGDTAAALDNYRRYAEADKAYLNEVKAREIAYQLAKQEALQKTQTIELLNKQNEVLTLQQRVAAQAAQNNRLLAALLALLLASIGYWAFRVKREQVRFRELAQVDALTGIANRHHFTRFGEEKLAQASASGQPIGLVMFDLDRFKAINDGYGHAAGDWVLTRVAATARTMCGRDDCVGRIGGEEFALLLVGRDLDASAQVAQSLCDALKTIDTSPTGHAFTVAASFGVSSTTLSGYALSPLLADADHAQYRSKREGRGRVSVATPDGTDRASATGHAAA